MSEDAKAYRFLAMVAIVTLLINGITEPDKTALDTTGLIIWAGVLSLLGWQWVQDRRGRER